MGKEGFEGLASVGRLLSLLLAGKTLTAKVIAKELGVGEATAMRRLDLLADLPHVLVHASRPRSVRLPTLFAQSAIGEGAVGAACLVSALANALQDTTMARQVARLRDEWVGKSRQPHATEDLDRKFWFVVRGGERVLPKAEQRLADVISALLDEREISFDYVHFDGRRERLVRAQPLTLALHEHQFYVIARIGDSPPHPFRFARMTSVRLAKKVPYPRDGEYDPKRLFHSVFGIFVGQPGQAVEQLRLRFSARWGDYVASHRWHHTQTERRVDEAGTTEVSLELRVCHELRAWLLGLGADVEVLEPASLREEIRAAHERAAAIYRPARAPGVAAATPKRATGGSVHRGRSTRRADR